MRQHFWSSKFKFTKLSLPQSNSLRFKELFSRMLKLFHAFKDPSTKYIVVSIADTRKILRLLKTVSHSWSLARERLMFRGSVTDVQRIILAAFCTHVVYTITS